MYRLFKGADWLFFDIGSTLVDESEAYTRRLREAIRHTDITYEQISGKAEEFYRENKKGDLEALAFFGLAKPPWYKEEERLYPDTAAVLENLHKRYKIGVIANQSAGSVERLHGFGIGGLIDLVIASAEEGMAKPDPRIFRLALERAHCPPERAVMIGDRLDNDIYPAKALGMKTVWVKQGFARFSSPSTAEYTADFTAESLTELLALE
ncbi:MAG: HAD family hydrolase [Oscillospiraceae bacterium]